MPTPTLVVGAPCWIDLYTTDTEKATEFYRGLFGWRAEPPDERFGGYFTFTKDGKHVAGCMLNDGQAGIPDVWTVYLMTRDVDRTVEAVNAGGGRVDLEPMQVAENGSMAMIADPGQASVGLWQPDRMNGFEVIGETGTPRWFELHTRDYERTVAFYRDVLGWDAQVAGDTQDFRYTTLGGGDDRRAGIMDAAAFLPEGAPGYWSVYFDVADTDAALATVVSLGGRIVEPAVDTPYGRLARAADPTGALFKLMSTT